jgi:uncharacterized protein (DUF433 family)
MTSELQTLEAKIDQALQRIDRLEKEREQSAPPWKYLVARPHPWRRQLSIKGRNMTVGQLLMAIRANQWTAEAASANYDLPLQAIQEALKYAEDERQLIDMEACEERRRVKERGHALEPQDLPR